MIDAPAIRGDRKRGPLDAEHRVVPGLTRKNLAEMFRDRGFTKGAEIGVADGRNSLMLCETIPGLQLRCVDPWEPYKGNTRGGPAEQHDENYRLARERLAPYAPAVTLVKSFSLDAARDVPLGSLDFCYIDANHSFDFAMEDIIVWSRRVRSSGIVAGHDCYHFRDAGVVEAVTAYTSWHNIEWHLCDEREPSFWFVKR
jgi:hypothetical protein